MEYIIGKDNMDDELKKEIQRIREHYIKVKQCGFQIDLRDVEVIAEHFANWQKEQMLKMDEIN